MKPKLIATSFALAFGMSSTFAQTALFSLDAALSGWTTGGSAVSQNTTFSTTINSNPYQISPASGHYMAVLTPSGVATGANGLATATGLTSSAINTVLTGSAGGGSDLYLQATNFAFISKDLSLASGTTYKFAWAYASKDYAPYADGTFFSVSQNGTGAMTILGRTSRDTQTISAAGTSTGFPAGTKVLESYGSTKWYSQTVTVGSSGVYKVTFGSFNVKDTSVDPILFISDVEGNVVGIIVGGSISVLSSTQATGNQPALAAANVIDSNPGLQALFSGLSGDNEISNAATQSLPLLLGSSSIAINSSLSGVNRVILDRISKKRGLSSGNNSSHDENVWIRPFGSVANQESQDGIAGFKANTYGLVLGLDRLFNESLSLGGAFAYIKSDVNSQSSIVLHDQSIDIYQLIGYGNYSLDDRTNLDFQIDVGNNVNKGTRHITFAGLTAKSDYNGLSSHLGTGLGRTYSLSSQTSITPSIRIDYTVLNEDSYAESGASLLNLNVDKRSTEALVVGFDGKITHKFDDRLKFLANLGVGYDTINERASIAAAYAGAPGASFVVQGIQPSPWILHGGVSATYIHKAGVEISARYDAEGRDYFLNQTASINLRMAF